MEDMIKIMSTGGMTVIATDSRGRRGNSGHGVI